MKVEHSAGEIYAVAYTDGSPQWITFTVDDVEFSIHPSAIHDLNYVVSRMMATLPEAKP